MKREKIMRFDKNPDADSDVQVIPGTYPGVVFWAKAYDENKEELQIMDPALLRRLTLGVRVRVGEKKVGVCFGDFYFYSTEGERNEYVWNMMADVYEGVELDQVSDLKGRHVVAECRTKKGKDKVSLDRMRAAPQPQPGAAPEEAPVETAPDEAPVDQAEAPF